jgi:hypothetical protein
VVGRLDRNGVSNCPIQTLPLYFTHIFSLNFSPLYFGFDVQSQTCYRKWLVLRSTCMMFSSTSFFIRATFRFGPWWEHRFVELFSCFLPHPHSCTTAPSDCPSWPCLSLLSSYIACVDLSSHFLVADELCVPTSESSPEEKTSQIVSVKENSHEYGQKSL